MFSTNPCCENEVEAVEREGAITLPAVTHLLFKKEKGVERLIDETSVKINEVMLWMKITALKVIMLPTIYFGIYKNFFINSTLLA